MKRFSRGVGLKDGKPNLPPKHTYNMPSNKPSEGQDRSAGPECPHFTPSRQPREAKLSHRNKLGLNFVQNSKDRVKASTGK